MRFTVLTNPSDHDAALCAIRFPQISSDAVVNTSSFAHLIPGNTKPLWLSLTANLDKDTSELSKQNIFGIPSITNEVYFIPETGEETPLYYRHQLCVPLYTHRTVAHEEFITYTENLNTEGIRLNTISGTTLVVDSVTIIYDGNTVFKDFYIDTGRLRIYPWDTFPVPSNGQLTVRYTSIPVDVSVTGERLMIYRPLVNSSGFPSLYYIDILSTSQKPMLVTYQAYDRTRGVSYTHVERTTASEIFEYVPIGFFSGQTKTYSDRLPDTGYYTVNSDGTIYVIGNPGLYYMRSQDLTYDTRLHVTVPRRVPFTEDWYATCSDSKITRTIGENTFTFDCTVDPSLTECRKERLVGNNSYIIQVEQSTPLYYRKHDGTIGGITVTIDNTRISSVMSVDISSNALYTEQFLTQQHNVELSYRSRSSKRAWHISLNPVMPSANKTPLSRDNIICVLIPPVESGVTTPLCATLPMYTEQGSLITYDYTTLDNLFNRSSSLQRIESRMKYIPLLPQELLNPDIPLIPIVAFYTINPITSASIRIDSTRTAGGGLSHYTPNCFDYSYYDGEGTDLSSMLAVLVSTSLIEDYAQRLALYDPVARDHDDPTEYARGKAREHLRTLIEKFTLPGTEFIIEEK